MSSPKKTIEVSSVSFPLNKRLILKKMFIPVLIILIMLLLLGRDLFLTWWLPASFLGAIGVLALFNYYYLNVFYYRLEEDYILIKRHAIHPKEIVIEYSRIKDIIIYRETLDRLFGLYQMRFESDLTSPTAHKMAYIEGLDEVEAEELKVVIDHLIEKALHHVR